MIIIGDCLEEMKKLDKVDLLFTSPPYFKAKPEYATYDSYEDYLHFMNLVFHEMYKVLNDGRFCVINISHVLIPRVKRSEESKRLAIPFDFHYLLKNIGFEFIDDIIWDKGIGAGFASDRGRRFSKDRNAMQYKTVPTTEHILVYRKPGKLIDYFIRTNPFAKESKIKDDYEKTDIWKINPAHSKKHPAIFPDQLAENIIKYYSFKNDTVLDCFAGSGTVGRCCKKLNRNYILIERKKEYIENFGDG